MNIFFLHWRPSRAARWHCDKHVVKMILETTQLLYTAHWVLAGTVAPDFSTAPTMKSSSQRGYRSIRNPKHPSAIWARASLSHYRWLCHLGLHLCIEHLYRFAPDAPHSCAAHLRWLLANPPASIPRVGWLSDPTPAMPDMYKKPSVIASYRAYYKLNKGERGLLVYTRRHAPHWLQAAASEK